MVSEKLEALKEFGSGFAFEFFLEVWKPKIIAGLKEWLESYTPEQIRKMVSQSKFPDVHGVNFSAVSDYLKHIEVISAEELFKDFLIPARPDLAEILLDIPADRGTKWFAKLREHILDQVRGVTKPVKQDIVQAKCDACKKSWPVPRDEFSSITSCPFCGHKQGEEVPESPEPAEEKPSEGPPRVVIDIDEGLEKPSES